MLDLDARLTEATKQVAQWERLQRRLDDLAAEERSAAAAVAQLQAQVNQEEQDVARLEGTSLTGLFYALLGSKEDRLRRERQEALAARLKLGEAEQRLAGLRAKIGQMQSEQQALAGCQAERQALLAQKEALIRQAPGDGAQTVFRLSEEEHQAQWQLQQLQEAFAAGKQAVDRLARAIPRTEEQLAAAQMQRLAFIEQYQG